MMAIRIRQVGKTTVALCAAETDAKEDDFYIDDGQHYALAAKFAHDYQGRIIDWDYPREWAVMATQKLRDAKETFENMDFAS
jgi:hypothetical protein